MEPKLSFLGVANNLASRLLFLYEFPDISSLLVATNMDVFYICYSCVLWHDLRGSRFRLQDLLFNCYWLLVSINIPNKCISFIIFSYRVIKLLVVSWRIEVKRIVFWDFVKVIFYLVIFMADTLRDVWTKLFVVTLDYLKTMFSALHGLFDFLFLSDHF